MVGLELDCGVRGNWVMFSMGRVFFVLMVFGD